MLIVDAHLDLAYNAARGRDVRLPASQQPVVDNEIATVGFPDLKAGGVGLICATIFCPPWRYGRAGYQTPQEAFDIAEDQLRQYQSWTSEGLLQPVLRAADLPSPLPHSPLPHPIKHILLLEGADAIRTPPDVAHFYHRGVRIIGLAWRQNRMAGGTGHPGPITPEGRAVVQAMDALHMIHDTSHLADESFWQLLDLTAGPLIASHSNCRSIVPGDRQLSDDMIRALLARDAVIGMNFYDHFLMHPDRYGKTRCTIAADLLPHIDHICSVAGDTKHVALGTDMDGGLGREEIPREFRTIADLPRLADALSSARYSDQDITNILSANWLHYFSENLP